MDSTLVAALVGPVVTAVLTGLGVWLREVRHRRNREQAHHRALAQAREQVSFIESWLRTHEQLASVEVHENARQQALRDLQQAYVRVDQSVTALRAANEPLALRRVLRRLFLIDAMHTTAARVLGIVYYVALAWAFVWVSFGVALAGSMAATNTTDSLATDALMGLGVFALTFSVGAAPTLLLYWPVSWADRRGSQPVPEESSTDIARSP